MSYIFKIVFVLFLGSCSDNSVKSDSLNKITTQDTTLIGTIVSIDTTSINRSQSKIGYLTYYGFFHFNLKLTDGRIVPLVRVFNAIDEYELYRNKFGLRINDKLIFYVYKYNPCDCPLPRMSGGCENGIFYPQNSTVTKPYSEINRVILIRPFK